MTGHGESGQRDQRAARLTSLARLDVNTWTLHDQSPSAVDEGADRWARGYFLFGEVFGWLMLPFVVIFVLPSLNDVATLHPLVLIAVTIGFAVTAVPAVFRHRALRRMTGAPVLPELRADFARTTEVLTRQQSGSDRGRLRRELLRQCELAAWAKWCGWERTRQRRVRKIAATCFAARSSRGER